MGISREGSLIDLGIDHDLVQKSGSFFSYGDTRLGQGRSNSKQFLSENPDISLEIETRILESLGITRDGSTIEAESCRKKWWTRRHRSGRQGQEGSGGDRRRAIRRGEAGGLTPDDRGTGPMADEVLAKALGAIGRKERTVAEMRAWLGDREIEPDEIDRVVNFLIENEALNDRKFAIEFTSDKREISGWGQTRIRETLRKRGMPESLIQEALAQDSGETEVDRAARIAGRTRCRPERRPRQEQGARTAVPARVLRRRGLRGNSKKRFRRLNVCKRDGAVSTFN